MKRAVYYADAAPGETFEMPCSCALFKHAQGIALFDTGCHPDAAEDGEGRWGAAVRYCEPIFEREAAVVGQLGLAGVEADDVDLVLCSHLHFDHCGCNAFFRNATVVCHARELEAARASSAVAMGYNANDWNVGRPIETIDGQHDVFGDGRLTLVPLPGHTPGTIGAHAVLNEDGLFLLASDAVPVEENLRRRFAPSNTVDIERCLASYEEVVRFERDGATILFGHDDGQWRSLRKGAEFYG